MNSLGMRKLPNMFHEGRRSSDMKSLTFAFRASCCALLIEERLTCSGSWGWISRVPNHASGALLVEDQTRFTALNIS